MSRLRTVSGGRLEDLLAAAPGALEADGEMRRQLSGGLAPRLYSLIAVAVAGMVRCENFVDHLRGPLESSFAAQVAKDWRCLSLSEADKAILSYAEKGTLDEASVRRRDVEALRSAGFSDQDILLIATAIAYHNYSIRMAAAFAVTPS
jgi:alkylhydroperoxidase family enzyme